MRKHVFRKRSCMIGCTASLILAVSVILLPYPVHSTLIDDYWMGPAAGDDYAFQNPPNWSAGVVPNNNPPYDKYYNAIIDGGYVTQNSTVRLISGYDIQNLTVSSGDTLLMKNGGNLALRVEASQIKV